MRNDRLRSLLLLMGAVLLAAANLASQTKNPGVIRGTVVDDSTRAPLAFVDVELFKSVDSALVTGAVSESSGKFDLNNIPRGEYYVKFSLVGYKERSTSAFTIDDQHRRLNLGTISLQSSEIMLGEVTVTAEQPRLESSIDRMVYNVEQDVTAKTASASEILENIPSVQINMNGEVSLRGSSRVLLMINGKRSPVLEKQEGTFLEQLPASSIEKIEVITTPSARYRAEGKSGIINIVLKKDTPLGTHGNLTAHAGNGGRYNSNARINYSPGGFNVYGSYSIRRDNRNRYNSDVRSVTGTTAPGALPSTYADNESSYYNPLTHLITLGVDYHIDELNSFGVSGSYFQNSFTRTDSSHRTLQDTRGIVITEYDRNGVGNEFDKERSVTANFHHTFSRSDHKIRLEFTASESPEEDDYDFTNLYLSPTFPTAYDNSLIRQYDYKSQVAVDYSNAFTRTSTLEAGYTGDFSRTDLDFYDENFDPAQNRFVEDSAKTSSFSFKETIHSFYVTYKESFGKFGFLAGLRAEQTTGRSSLITLDSQVVSDYTNLFPSAHLSYTFSSITELRLSYSRRTSRPRARDLNPFAEYRDPKNLSFGNPFLQPEYLHSLELGCQYQRGRLFVLPTLFYRYSSNGINSIKQLVNRSTLLTTKENVLSNRSGGVELIVSLGPGGFITGHLSTTALYEELDATNLGDGQFKSTLSWSGTFTSNLNFTKDTRLEIHSHFNSLRLTPQGEYRPSASFGMGFRQELWEGKLSLLATATDIFGTLRRDFQLDIPRLHQTVLTTHETRAFYVGFTYRLGKAGGKLKEEQFHYDDDE
jgi:outer membrane receptor protein involved in Fe transport